MRLAEIPGLGADSAQQIAILAVAHRIARIIWKILHDAVRYEERAQRTNPAAAAKRGSRLIAQLRRLGYDVRIILPDPATTA